MKTLTNTKQAEGSPVRAGLFSLVFSGISAAISITAILTWIHMAGSTATIDSGGPAFSAYFIPNVISLLGVVSGGFALLVTCCSIWFGEKRVSKALTFYQICSFVLLCPAAFLLVAMIT